MVTLADLRIGESIDYPLVQDLKRTQLVQYAGAAGDFNPLHTDERYAIEVGGFEGVFAHGMLTAGMTATMLDRLVGYASVVRFGGRFLEQVWPGDDLTGTATIADRRVDGGRTEVVVELATRNQRGAIVFSGSAVVVESTADEAS